MDALKHLTSSSPVQTMVRLVLAHATVLVILGGCIFFDEIDRCLDRGGEWNDAANTCEYLEEPSVEAREQATHQLTRIIARHALG